MSIVQTSRRVAPLAAVAAVAFLFGAPAFAQSKSMQDTLGDDKNQPVQQQKKPDGDGSGQKPGAKSEGGGVKPEGKGDDSSGKSEGSGPARKQGGAEGSQPEGSGGGVRSATNPNCDPTFGGRYANLVRKIYLPGDRRQYGMCRNYGLWNGTY